MFRAKKYIVELCVLYILENVLFFARPVEIPSPIQRRICNFSIGLSKPQSMTSNRNFTPEFSTYYFLISVIAMLLFILIHILCKIIVLKLCNGLLPASKYNYLQLNTI